MTKTNPNTIFLTKGIFLTKEGDGNCLLGEIHWCVFGNQQRTVYVVNCYVQEGLTCVKSAAKLISFKFQIVTDLGF